MKAPATAPGGWFRWWCVDYLHGSRRFTARVAAPSRTQALRKFRRESGLLKVVRCYAELETKT